MGEGEGGVLSSLEILGIILGSSIALVIVVAFVLLLQCKFGFCCKKHCRKCKLRKRRRVRPVLTHAIDFNRPRPAHPPSPPPLANHYITDPALRHPHGTPRSSISLIFDDCAIRESDLETTVEPKPPIFPRYVKSNVTALTTPEHSLLHIRDKSNSPGSTSKPDPKEALDDDYTDNP